MSTVPQETFVCTMAVSQVRGCSSSATPLTSGVQSAVMAGIVMMARLLVGSSDSMTPVSLYCKARHRLDLVKSIDLF